MRKVTTPQLACVKRRQLLPRVKIKHPSKGTSKMFAHSLHKISNSLSYSAKELLEKSGNVNLIKIKAKTQKTPITEMANMKARN